VAERRTNVQPTGVDIIDRALGGIAPGLPLIVAGPSGSGRTVLSLELAASALDGGQVVAYLCNEPCPFILQQASALGFDFEPFVAAGQLLLLELDPDVGRVVKANGLDALVAAVREEEPLTSLLIVDPFTVVTAELMDEPALRTAARGFVRSAAPMSMLLTLESEQLALQRGVARVLSEICGSMVTLHRNEQGKRSLAVEKTRSGVAAEEVVPFEIIGHGIRGLPAQTTLPSPATRRVTPDDPAPEIRASSEVSARPGESAAELPDAPAVSTATRRRPLLEEPTRKKILIVDSDPAVRTTVAKWLEADYDVAAANDGFEAMTSVVTQRPDLVVLDLLMPRVTGYELLGAFQRVANNVPMLVISSRITRPGDRVAPLVLGATDVLPKPVDRFEFLHKVHTLLRLEGPPTALMDPAEAEALFATIADSRQLDPEAFQERLTRASRFGQRFGLPSSLVSVSARSAHSLGDFLAIADKQLRFEDAILRVSRRRAVVLLVAVDAIDASSVMERLESASRADGGKASQLEMALHDASATGTALDDSADRHDWHRLFRRSADDESEDDS
jgi:DNA-binding response OmpR family regulator/KaiC/GvpD/RAD55 family RecA-like ATPase